MDCAAGRPHTIVLVKGIGTKLSTTPRIKPEAPELTKRIGRTKLEASWRQQEQDDSDRDQ
jgi:hypothetical protein